MHKYIDLILKCGKPGAAGFDHVMKLVHWKDTREVFWSQESEFDIANQTISFEEALNLGISNVMGSSEEEISQKTESEIAVIIEEQMTDDEV